MQKLSGFGFLLVFTLINLEAALAQRAENNIFYINYEKFVLDNGLEVVFHIDPSDPVVAVNLTVHVGSARETEGRTGFAHMFEHLLFLESENLGKGGLDKLSTKIGGSGANGSTSHDRTNYLQTVPKDGLEKMLWAEADKLGWFINTVTAPVLEKEKQVVKNEKRQSSDNAPYGHNSMVINQNLYPPDHPYHWQVIGSLEDIQAATLDDVKQFFHRWYVPNNVTLTLAGDFDPVQAKKWVEKYFAEIKAGDDIKPLQKRAAKLTETKKLYHEDNFANQPQLTRVYPTVEAYHPDSYALDVLFDYLSEGKSAPLYDVLVQDKKLVPKPRIYHRTNEIAGQVYVYARAYAGLSLDAVNDAIDLAFDRFEKNGMSERDLQRILSIQETEFYGNLSSVLAKGRRLANYNIFTGDPGYAEKEINAILSVTTADVKRVYNQYIKKRPHIITSFVPKGQVELAVQGSQKANVTEELVLQGAEKQVSPDSTASYAKTPSTFDRSKEPPYWSSVEAVVPDIWQAQLDNMQILGIEVHEVPLVDIEIVFDGGQLLEPMDKVGISNLLAQLLTSGTKDKAPQELENAINQLGAIIEIEAKEEDIRFRVHTLTKNVDQTMALVKEMLLSPRWDKNEFNLIKQQTVSSIRQEQAHPRAIAWNTFNKLIYGEEHIRAKNILGTVATIESITIDDLKTFYRKNILSNHARVHVVGAINKQRTVNVLSQLKTSNTDKTVTYPTIPKVVKPKQSKVYFYDVPNAKQSIICIGYPALAATEPDYYPATIMNYILGGGSFASRLTQELRERKGYTYSISSGFYGSKDAGTFEIYTQVRTNVTLESSVLIKDTLDDYASTFTHQDLLTTKSFLIKSNARAFETAWAKLRMLDNISKYDWPYDYVKQREKVVKSMTIKDVKKLAKQYLDTSNMIWLIVGDASSQLPRMKALGFGKPILLSPSED